MTKLLQGTRWVAPSTAGVLDTAKVLIIDDQEDHCFLLARQLRVGGFQHIETLPDARGALAEVRAWQPDAVLLDMHMPYLSGLEVLKQLRDEDVQDGYLPIIMLTADSSPELKRLALALGANDFVAWPFDPDEVLLRLGNLLQTRALHQKLQQHNTELSLQVADYTCALRQREAAARRAARQYSRLAELSARLETCTLPLDVAREGLQTFMELWSFDAGVLYQMDDGWLSPSLVVGKVPERATKALKALDLHSNTNLMKRLKEEKGPVLIEDYSNWEGNCKDFRDTNLTTLIATAIHVKDDLFGVMYVGKFGGSTLVGSDAKAILRAIQLRIERALERIDLLNNLADTRLQALRVVGLTLEYRDYETKGHTDRVTELAQRLGKMVGLEEEALQHLTWGSYLHDTGKIAMPDHILLKPGELTYAEFDTIKRHVVIGEEMLTRLGFLPPPVLEIVRHHHERWDGCGYPDGLKGEAIPYLARLFSIADVYDALTSERPYKEAWPHEKAVAELRSQRAKQFDPEALDAFLSLFPISLERVHGSGLNLQMDLVGVERTQRV